MRVCVLERERERERERESRKARENSVMPLDHVGVMYVATAVPCAASPYFLFPLASSINRNKPVENSRRLFFTCV